MIRQYIRDNKERFIEELMDLLRIPSVSAVTSHKKDMYFAAEQLKQRLIEAGIDTVHVYDTKGHPIVFGEKYVDDTKPTVLIYGHYDVQPANPLSLWDSPPFEPIIKNDQIYARGASDDKGQLYMHVKAFETMMQLNCLTCNVKFLIEGEEEIGSPHLKPFIRQHKEQLKADTIVVSDTAIVAMDCPSITVGLRGISCLEIAVTGPKRDLHSGIYGGAVANPINILCYMLASLHDEQGRVAIPSFYDTVKELSSEDRRTINAISFSSEQYKQSVGIGQLKGEEGYTTLERIGIRPSLDINGIWGGYLDEGSKTVLPSKAHAKISMRLVPDQQSGEITELVIRHIESITPPSVTTHITRQHGGDPFVTPMNTSAYRAACKAFKKNWNKEPVPSYDGGSIPIATIFKQELFQDALFMGFGLNSDAIHSCNEHYGIKNFIKGVETIVSFHHYFAELEQ